MILMVLMMVVIFLILWFGLLEMFMINVVGYEVKVVKNWYIFFCVGLGLWVGLIIGFVMEYFISNVYM